MTEPKQLRAIEEPLIVFCRMVRSRSQENSQAMDLMYSRRLYGQCMAILRQEVDSMVRTIFLLKAKPAHREDLLRSSLAGEFWVKETGKGKVSDRDMVDLGSTLQGWTASVYKFGCGFIHLSRFHDYNDADPLAVVSPDDRKAILHHMRYHHGGPATDEPEFGELAFYFPQVFDKITSNLECYLKDLEKNLETED